MKTTKILITLYLSFFMMAAGAYAQRGPCGHGPGFGQPAVMNDAVWEFIKQKRLEFDNELSANEKETIQEMRVVMEQHREMIKNLNPGEMSRQERRQMHFNHLEQLDPLFDIADNHEQNLESIHDDIMDFRQDNCPQNQQGKRFRKGNKGKHMGRMGGPEDRHLIHFLLMDPTLDPSEMFGGPTGAVGLNLYPNPSSSELNIDFMLKNDGEVVIELLDQAGDLIRVLDKANREAGLNHFSFSLNDLSGPDYYFIRVKMPENMMVKKFVRK